MIKNLFLITSLAFTLILSNAKSVRFNLPSIKRKNNYESKTSSSSQSSKSNSITSSSSSSSTEEENDQNFDHNFSETKRRFKNLKKDDDKIKPNKKRKSDWNKKKKHLDKHLKSYKSGKQFNTNTNTNINRKRNENENGFVYNRDWHKKMKKFESEFTEEVGLLQLNGFIESFEKETQGTIKEPLNVGWWLISFGEGMSESKTVFKFKIHHPIRVSLVDLFCRGDSFSVLDGGNLIAQSSRTLQDRECWERMIDPDEAIADGRWSSVVFNLDSGDHEVEIKTVDSPMTGGLAAIRFDPVHSMRKVSRKNVCRGYNGLLLITDKLSKYEAEGECNEFKSDLAVVSGNETEVLKSLESCLGQGSEEMVWAYRKDIRDIEPFSLEGFSKPADDEDELRFVLCRVRTDI